MKTELQKRRKLFCLRAHGLVSGLCLALTRDCSPVPSVLHGEEEAHVVSSLPKAGFTTGLVCWALSLPIQGHSAPWPGTGADPKHSMPFPCQWGAPARDQRKGGEGIWGTYRLPSSLEGQHRLSVTLSSPPSLHLAGSVT